jgi:hypothetical protein
MKSIVTQCIHIVLALFILAAAVTPACAGTENCSMPCCRHKAKPVPQLPAAAPPKACCTHPADASSGIGSGCRFDQHNLALNSEDRTVSTPTAPALVTTPHITTHGHAWTAFRMVEAPQPFKDPLYLRIQIFLI